MADDVAVAPRDGGPRGADAKKSTTAVAIHVEGLTKRFGDLVAVDSISFEIERGEVFGLLGPNGAGKTTTISMLATLLRPSAGSATVDGRDVERDQDGVRHAIGIVFQDQSLDEELTAWENMDLHGRLYRIPGETRRRRIAELLDLVGLSERKDDIVKTFSGGMRRRLEIARGLLHRPSILFLDEPTLGLDPQTRNLLWEYIANLASEEGITIILTTHYMEEADRLCDRVAIIDHGRIVAMDTPERLKDAIGGDVVIVRTPRPEAVAPALDEPWITRVDTREGEATISVPHAEQHLPAIVTSLTEQRVPIESIAIRKPTLEDVFLHFTGTSIREGEATGVDQMRRYARLGMRRH